jgi:hypothetical protein
MLTEELPDVNVSQKEARKGGRVTSRWQRMKIERGDSGNIAETVCDKYGDGDRQGEMLACLRRVCYKSVA